MGGCVGSHHDSSGSLNENSDGTGVALGRNHSLKRDKPKWKSDYPMTDGQLRSKRDEFWDTAPAFEGRKEIWDALKAAAHAFESNDHELAQAILDGASITLPHDVPVIRNVPLPTPLRFNLTGHHHTGYSLCFNLIGYHHTGRPDGVLRRAREPLPAASLLPGPAHQHDRGEERVGGPRGAAGAPGRLGAGVPAASAALHGAGPAAGRAHRRLGAPHEAPPAGRRGRGARRPALVLLGPAAGRPDDAGGAEDLPGLRGAGDRQPAPGSGPGSASGHAPARAGPHTCGKLARPSPYTRGGVNRREAALGASLWILLSVL
ncbi:uncharacterized protein LOC135263674 isoform X3 [Anguilla rostrata]|uniref:uncharacterized protein LOC135263674 isoform X3 n=1 Tax=Anguilla rostrata TaxID=7938 RepID=UPI0030D13DD3